MCFPLHMGDLAHIGGLGDLICIRETPGQSRRVGMDAVR